MITIHWDINSAFNSLSDISPLLIYHNILLSNVSPLLILSSIIRIFLCLLLSSFYAISFVSLPKKSSLLIKKKVNRDALELTFPCHYLPTIIYIGFWNFMRCFLHLFSLSVIYFPPLSWIPLRLSNGQFQPLQQIARLKIIIKFLPILTWISPLGLWWLFDCGAYHHPQHYQ